MRIVVDTNIAFSAILNSNSRIAGLLLQPKSKLSFYSTGQLLMEINEHRGKLKRISKYTDAELERAISIISARIRFINVGLIPKETLLKAEALVKDVDIDDVEFVALADHAKAWLWTGDQQLITGLKAKNWNRCVSTQELYTIVLDKLKKSGR